MLPFWQNKGTLPFFISACEFDETLLKRMQTADKIKV